MSKLALVSLVFLQIQVSSQAVAEGRLLRGGIYLKQPAAQPQTTTPEQWESRKFVRYIGEVDYELTDRVATPNKAAPPANKPRSDRAPKPHHPRSRR